MDKFYITFGQCYAHRISGKTLDKDCVAELQAKNKKEAHSKAMEWFNGKFHRCLSKEDINDDFMRYFPRGIIKI